MIQSFKFKDNGDGTGSLSSPFGIIHGPIAQLLAPLAFQADIQVLPVHMQDRPVLKQYGFPRVFEIDSVELQAVPLLRTDDFDEGEIYASPNQDSSFFLLFGVCSIVVLSILALAYFLLGL